jgi:hypothetical protein
MPNRLLDATRNQVRALVILTVLLVAVIFSPALKWAPLVISRKNPVKNAQIQATIPRTWLLQGRDSSFIEAWKPCLTLFCSVPRPSFKITRLTTLIGNDGAWRRGTESVLEQRRFSTRRSKSFGTPTGPAQCLEAWNPSKSGEVLSTCLVSQSGIMGTFEGSTSDLTTFYSVLQSSDSVPDE